MVQCFNALAQRNSARWILEGDITACFDQISHEWLLNNVMIDKLMLRKWLKAGYVERRTLHPIDAGTPQGGIISPSLAVTTLSGLESVIQQSFRVSDRVHVVTYADDFIVTGASKEILEKVKPIIKAFLGERGLKLSDKKTKITTIDEGFDFLGCNVRKYNGKLIRKPSMKSVKSFIANIRETFHDNQAASASNLIRILNSKILGWAYYHRSSCAKRTFNFVDHHIFRYVIRWINRKHPNKSWTWKHKRYFCSMGLRNWVFHDVLPTKNQRGKIQKLYLARAASVVIKRHIKIRGAAHPFNPECFPYLAKRKALLGSTRSKGINRLIARYFDVHDTHEQPGLS